MTALAPHLTAFLRQHLPVERRASPATLDTYAHALRLLVCFAAERLGVRPSQLEVEALDAQLVLDFLNYLETGRGNSARTRNARLAAVTSLFRYLEYRLPSCLDQAGRIRAIPVKRTDEALVRHLTREEVQALLDTPDPHTASGARDRAMLHLAFAAGLRVSELVGLRLDQLHLTPEPVINVMGKGRRERILPLWRETAAAVRAWLAVRDGLRDPTLFLGAGGQALTRAGFEYILAKHAIAASRQQPSLAAKRVTPHMLRHSCAMHMLQATHDIRRVSLWLGHASLQSTEIYLRADPTEKLEALNAAVAPSLRRGQFRPPDMLIAMLQSRRQP